MTRVRRAPIVAALYVDPTGPYWDDPRCDCWGESRDARNYTGPLPVVAHPPCSAWCKVASLREYRYGMPAGIDGGCFASALQVVRRYGGVLEQPMSSLAWEEYGLPKPVFGSWQLCGEGKRRNWVTTVWQVAYGHRARKATWLLYVGDDPPADLIWEKPRHCAIVSGSTNHNATPTDAGRRVWHDEAIRTPPAFADALIRLVTE